MTQLRRSYPDFRRFEAEILVIGPDSAKAFQQYWQQENLPFPGLPDPERRVLNLYAQEVRLFKLGRMPASMVVDKEGLLQLIHYGKSMADIPPSRLILDVITRLKPAS
jgi:peroxiredoxin